MRRTAAATILAAVFLVAAALPSWAGSRVALVIGNSDYANVSTLTNPKNDAAAVADAFRKAGFDSVTELDDLDQTALRRALQDFTRRTRGADIAVVYYAGHGVEVAGRNYLVPVDATLAHATDVDFEAIPLENVRTAVSGASKLRLVILDACRNNPFKLAAADGKRSIGRGLARIEPSANELIAYAARDGTVASDGEGGHSPYARALVKYLDKPGLEIRLMFGRIRDDVVKATSGEQEPFIYGTLGGQSIFLDPGAGATQVAASAPTSGGSGGNPLLGEAASVWTTVVKDTQSPAVLEAYIARYKGTVFADMAAARLSELSGGDAATHDAADTGGAQVANAAATPEPVAPSPPPVVTRSLTETPRVAVVGKWAEGLAFDGKSLWVAESGQRTIAELSLSTGKIARRIHVGRLPVGMEAGPDGTVYSLVNTDKIVWAQPSGSAKGKRLTTLHECPQDLAVGQTAIWVLVMKNCSTVDSHVVRVDPRNGRQVDTLELGEWGQAITAGLGKVYVAHARFGVVNVIDPNDLSSVFNIIVDGASFWDITTNSSLVYAGGRVGDDNNSGLIVAIDPRTNKEVMRQNVGELVNAIVADDRSVVAIGINGKIWVLSPDTLAIEKVITLTTGNYRPSDALILGDQLVVVCQQCQGDNGEVLAVGNIR